MHLKLRSKAGGHLQVLDGDGKPIEGVLSVELHADGRNSVPMVRIVCLADVVVDTDAVVREEMPRQHTAPEGEGGAKIDG